ncbi:putative reverse transcriptase domain-containing protein [Tanacetum coccineum]
MAGRNTRSSTANNINPPNETTDEVTRQLNTALPNLLTQLVQAPKGNQANQREATPSCSIKTFRASGTKKFFGTKGAVGLLTWFESIESVFHITKCPAESLVEFAASMLQGRALTWWNTLDQTRGRAAVIAQSWDDFKKLLMEEYCPDDEVQKLESEFWNHKMVGSDIDGKKENARNKRRSNDQNRNRGRDDRNKRQRTGGNFALIVSEQVTKWGTLPDTAWVELLMKDQGQLAWSVEILTTLRGIAQG